MPHSHRPDHRLHAWTRRGLPAVVTVALATAVATTATGTAAAKTSAHHATVRIPQGAAAAPLESSPPLGDTPPDTPVTVSFILRARNLPQLQSAVQHGWTGGYLTPSQFAAKYGQTHDVISAIRSYLAHFGIKTMEFGDRLDISAHGTAGQFNKALSIDLKNFRVKQTGATRRDQARSRTVYGTRKDPQVPAKIGHAILAVLGLSNYAPFDSQAVAARAHSRMVHPVTGTGIPQGDGLGPQDFADHYNLTPLQKQGALGQGQTIGIVTLASINPKTPLTFWNDVLGLNVPASRLKILKIDGGSGPVSAKAGSDETDLDVEQSGAIAPKADLKVYEAPNTDPGFADAFYKVASENVADTVSVSWGESDTIIQSLVQQAKEPRAYAQVFDQVFAELAAQGQSDFAATGDYGAYQALPDAGTTNLATGNPSDSPYTTATGGTTLPGTQTYGVADSDGNLTGTESVDIPKEIAWGWDYLWPLYKAIGEPDEATAATDGDVIGGSNGGYSALEPRPTYQSGVSAWQARRFLISTDRKTIAPGLQEPTAFGFNPTPAISRGSNDSARAIPDLSANGDPQTGYAVYDPKLFGGDGFAQYGGVSFVAPQMNGATAVINSAVGHRVGFWNPSIYRWANSTASPFTPINDTTVYKGRNFLYQTDLAGHSTALPGEFTSTNLFYTGRPGSTWNPAVGLGTPDLAALAARFSAS